MRVAVASLLGVSLAGAVVASTALIRVAQATRDSMSERKHEEIPLLALSEDMIDFTGSATTVLLRGTTTVQAAARRLEEDAARVEADIGVLSSVAMDDPDEITSFQGSIESWQQAQALLAGAGPSERADRSSARVRAIFSRLDAAASGLEDAHDIALDEVGEHFAAAEHTRDIALGLVASATGVAGLLALLAGRRLTRSIVPPLRGLRDAAGRIASGNFDEPISRQGPAELGAVADSFNEMAVRLRKRDEDLLYRALHDPLTELGNRALLDERLTNALARRKSGATVAVELLVMDLDGFKRINDSLGHACGDVAIKMIGERVRGCLQEDDTLCRLGGDEFAVALEGPRSRSDDLARCIAEAISKPLALSRQTLVITASIGIATADAPRSASDQMLRDASLAIEEAKSAGGNRVERFQAEMHEQAAERLALESDLRAALQRDELAIYYQPVVDLRTGKINGVEALVRWNHPKLGFLLPGRFIEMAEQTDLIVELGYQVLGAACAEVTSWIGECNRRSDFTLAVNVSARQVVQADFVERVIRTIDLAGLPPRNLVIEITERVLVAELAQARDKLTRLREMGVRIALDDFGTGYTSLQYLQSLPVDILKIDRCFVDGVARRTDLEVIVRSVLSLASGLGYEVIAEGVEQSDDADLLRSLGCTEAQGFGLHRPGPPSTIRSLLRCDDSSREVITDAPPTPDRVRAPSSSDTVLAKDSLVV